MDLEHVSTLQVVAWTALVGVLAWASAHFGIAKKLEAAASTAKAEAAKVTTKVESYTDDELVKLTGALVTRLADTSDMVQKKADADAEILRRSQLLSRVQTVVAAAKTTSA